MTGRSPVARRPGPPPPGDAEFTPRLLSWLIDLAGIEFVHAAIIQLVGPGYNVLFNDLGSQADGPIVYVWRVLALGLVELSAILALEVVFLRTLGATPGQRLVGLLTVSSESGLVLPWPHAVGRAVLSFVPWIAILVIPSTLGAQLDVIYEEGQFAWVNALPLAVRALAVLWYGALALSMMRAPDGRGFHDLASRSVVVAQRDGRGGHLKP